MGKHTKLNIRRIVLALILLSAVIFAANLPASIQVGVDGHYRMIRMPLYVKWTEFLARHYEYVRLAKEITVGYKTDEEKALAILKWTKDNLKDVPPGMPVHDDHILNIIIRGYGIPEQFQDVFTTLCSYSKIPAYWTRQYDKSHKMRYAISLIKLNGKWRLFDAYYGTYFRTTSGEIAALDDIVREPALVSGKEIGARTINGIPYKDFFCDLSGISKPATTRSECQMPFPRLVYEFRNALKIER